MITIFSKIKWRYVKKFLTIAGSITGIYLVVAAAVTLTLIAADNKVLNSLLPERPTDTRPVMDQPTENEEETSVALPTPTPAPGDEGTLLRPPARTNFLIIALDKGGMLTDVMMAGCFYRDACEVRLMSIPRDTYTRLTDERLERMREDGRHPPSVLKLTELRSYGGQAHGTQYLIEQLGEMLGVEFQYYAEVGIPAFKKIVDALGGVDMEIPDGGLYYDDSYQDLHIALPAGMTHLDGDKAEQLVRYRQYSNGDLGRNAVQMEFLKQLVRQSLTREAIMNDPLAIVNTIMTDVRTNIGPDIIKYMPYVTKFSGDRIRTYTLSGYAHDDYGPSYFFPDEDELPGIIQEVFYATPPPLDAPEDPSEMGADEGAAEGSGTDTEIAATETTTEAMSEAAKPSAGLRIQILNGSRVAGKASSLADELRYDGYNIVDTDTYDGSSQNATRIRVREDGMGEDLAEYFKGAELETADVPSGYDIVIIVGQGEG